jgi:D-3-phosphoglycerate dehydrogenase
VTGLFHVLFDQNWNPVSSILESVKFASDFLQMEAARNQCDPQIECFSAQESGNGCQLDASKNPGFMKHVILISDRFDAEGVARLQKTDGFEVIYKGGHTKEELLADIERAHGLIIRSATKVTPEVLAKAANLKLIVRAGVGVDNINIPEASRRGVIVMNAPGGSSVTTAEQALALMFAIARNTPQANASIKAGKWEKNKYTGVEITGKTIGVVGLGRIGREFVKRARGLKMNVIGFDPYIPAESLQHLEIEIVSKDELLARSDFITVHAPLTDETRDFINRDNLHKLKKGVRLINAARGGIYNEEALEEGLKSGHIAAVGLDVFTQEPIPENFPLRNYENCVMTPHLGASTSEAEYAVAMETIDELVEFFRSGVARNAINFPSIDAESMDFMRPYFEGGEKVGTFLARLLGSPLRTVEIDYNGEISEKKADPVRMAILKGALSVFVGHDMVNYVNAPLLAKERGVRVIENRNEGTVGYKSSVVVTMEGEDQKKVRLKYTAIAGRSVVVSLYDREIEFRPEGILLVVQNRDVPGVVGTIGTFLGDLKINIASIELSRSGKGETAISVITVDDLLTAEQIDKFRSLYNILSVHQIDLR